MHQLPNKQVLSLLVHAYNKSIKDFYYFPDVIFIGEQRITKEEFNLLLAADFIEEYQHDSFGRFYKLSKKAKDCLHEFLAVKRAHKRKKVFTPATQASFCFA